MEKELKELNEALLLFKQKVDESNEIALETKHKLQDVIHGSHLRGILTCLQSDFHLKRMLDLSK